jgi:hypothetical protein
MLKWSEDPRCKVRRGALTARLNNNWESEKAISQPARECANLASKERTTLRNYKYGLGRTRLHNIWRQMKERCYHIKNDRYESYGMRGIRVCEEWKKDFLKFNDWANNNGYNKNLTLDRKDNNDHYCPQNCRWTDDQGQLESKYNNRIIIAWEEMNSLIRWIKDPRCVVDIEIAKYRLKLGWSPEDTFSKVAYLG